MMWLAARYMVLVGLLLLAAASAQEAATTATCLGGHDAEMVIGHFRKLQHPYLMVTERNRPEIDRKSSSDDPILKQLWANLEEATARRQMDGAAFRAAYRGKDDPAAAELAEAVRQWRFQYMDGQHWWDDYLSAADMMRHLYAFDAAMGVGLLTDEDEKAFAAQVEGLIEGKQFKKRLTHPAAGQENMANWSGNINESVAVAQCLAALTLPDHPQALNWYRDGAQYLQMCYDQEANGPNFACEAEGQTYQVGFAHQVLALLAVPLEENGFAVVQRDDNFIEESFDWAVSSLMPDLVYPTTEDAWPNNSLSGIWPARYASTPVRKALLWHYRRLQTSPLARKYPGRGFEAAANLMAYDPKDVPEEAVRPRVRFSELASVAVFGTDWSPDGSWLYFLGDRTPWRYSYRDFKYCTNNKPHAHGDQTSFSLYALGQYLATESTRFSGTVAKDHNLILVDGKTEEPTPFEPAQFTKLSRAFDTAGLAGATMECAYAGITLRRSILMVKRAGDGPETEYYVVFDDIAAQGNHTYDWLLHNRMQGATIETEANAAHVKVADAALDVIFAGVEPAQIEVKQAKLPQYEEVFLDARASGEGDVRWLTVLYPRKAETAAPQAERPAADAVRLRIGDVQDLILAGRPGEETSVEGVSMDGAALFLRRGADGLQLYLRGGKRVALTGGSGSAAVLESTVPVVAALRYTQEQIKGTIVAEAPATVTVRWLRTGGTAQIAVSPGVNEVSVSAQM